jgi:hypothetical protein
MLGFQLYLGKEELGSVKELLILRHFLGIVRRRAVSGYHLRSLPGETAIVASTPPQGSPPCSLSPSTKILSPGDPINRFLSMRRGDRG